jgi:hypothetical protein
MFEIREHGKEYWWQGAREGGGGGDFAGISASASDPPTLEQSVPRVLILSS